MARNNDSNRGSNARTEARDPDTGRFEARERRRDRVVNTVKERPYAVAALATVAAGAAAFFLTRNRSDKPLMDWAKDTAGDALKAVKAQGSTTTDRSLETESKTPSSSAGTGAGTAGTSPSAMQAASLSGSGHATSASGKEKTVGSDKPAILATPKADAPTAGGKTGTGLDEKSKTETKAGAISYGA